MSHRIANAAESQPAPEDALGVRSGATLDATPDATLDARPGATPASNARDGASAWSDPAASTFLLRSARAGDRRSLDELVRRYEPRLLRIVRARLPASLATRVEPTEIVDAALHSAAQQIASFEPQNEASLLHWLATIAANKIRDELDRMRAQKRDCGREVSLAALGETGSGDSSSGSAWQPAGRETSPSGMLFRKELEELFDAAVRDLPDDQREVVLLRDYCRFDWESIARKLGRANAHAACQLHQRAWIALRRALGPKLRDSM